MIFDTHAHYNAEAFDEDREELLDALPEAGIARAVNVSAEWESLEETRAHVERYPFLYAAYGIHPDNVGDLSEERMDILREYCLLPKTVAVGEIGLDYYWNKESKDVQMYWFERQTELARELKLPVIIHSRDAAEDTFLMARKLHLEDVGGVVHCYGYSRELAREYVKMGLFIGVGGVVTFKNGRKLKETVEDIPLEYLVTETDCPYLAPVPFRGKRNSSLYLPYVIDMIAEIKGISREETEKVLWENAHRLYRLPPPQIHEEND